MATSPTAHLQSNNLNDALRARNARTEAEIRQRYDVAAGVGGPIVRSRLWFYAGVRRWATSSYQPNNYFNATQGTLFYTPDLSQPAYDLAYYTEVNSKFTWQATPKQKVTLAYVTERNCNCFFQLNTGTLAPEAAGSNLYDPNYRVQGTWTYPLSERVMLWAGVTHQFNKANRMTEGIGQETHRSILELSNNFRYNAPGSSLILPNSWGTQDSLQSNQNFSLSYTPSSHLFKVGFTTMQGIQEKDSRIADSMTFTFRDRVPQSITLWATPYYLEDAGRLRLGLRRGSVDARPADAEPGPSLRRAPRQRAGAGAPGGALRSGAQLRRRREHAELPRPEPARRRRARPARQRQDRVEGIGLAHRHLPGAGRAHAGEQPGQRDGDERDAHLERQQPRLRPAGERARSAVQRQLRPRRAQHLLRRRRDPRMAHARVQLAGLACRSSTRSIRACRRSSPTIAPGMGTSR